MNLALKLLLISFLITIQSCGGGSSSNTGVDDGSITKSNATLSWMSPTQNIDDSLLLAGQPSAYRIYYGTQQDSLSLLIELLAVDHLSNSYRIEYAQNSISNNTDIFIAMTAVSSNGIESEYSEIIKFNTQ
jgi:hypothetical protein